MAPITVVEFAETECRVLQADRARGKPAVRTLFSFNLPPNEDPAGRVAQRAHLLREALRAHKLRPGRVVVVIPKNYVMSRMVILPSIDDHELVGMARFEADRHIPFNAERHVVSHSVLAKLGVQGSQVLLAAIDQPVAQEYLDVCLGASLQVERLSFSTISLYNGFAFAQPDALTDKVIALVNIGLTHLDLCIINNGILTFSRSVTAGIGRLLTDIAEADPTSDFTLEKLAQVDALEPHLYFHAPGTSVYEPAELSAPPAQISLMDESSGIMPSASAIPAATLPQEGSPEFTPSVQRMLFTNWLLRLLQEIKKTYEYARREFNVPMIDTIYLSGDGATVRNLPQFINVNFNVQAAVFNATSYADIPAKVQSAVESRAPALALVLGAGVSPATRNIDINLLPPQYIEQKQTKRQQRSFITTGILAFAAIILGYVYLSGVFASRSRELTELQSKNSTMASSVADLKAKEVRLGIIEEYVKDEHGALDILERISSMPFIPEQLTLKDIKYDKGLSVRISGYAKEMAHINRFQAALQETGFFDTNGVTQESGTGRQTKLQGRDPKALVYEYTILAKFKPREGKKKTGTGNSEKKAETQEETNGSE